MKKRRSGQITMEFSQKFIDILLGCLDITSRVTTVMIQAIPKEDQIKCIQKTHVSHGRGQIALDVSTQRRHQKPKQGAFQIFVKSSGTRNWDSQASSQVRQSSVISSTAIRPEVSSLSWILKYQLQTLRDSPV